MTQYLVYSDDSSNKFWHICTEGNRYTVNFGKVGTAGQTQTKSFGSAEEAEAAAEKQAAAKMKKGYVPAEPPTEAPAPDKAAAPKAAAAKPAAKKAAPVAAEGGGPAPVKDDGKQKAWHLEDGGYWEDDIYLPEEEDFAIEALQSPLPSWQTSAPGEGAHAVQTGEQEPLFWGDPDADGDRDNSFNTSTFGSQCQNDPLEKVQAAYAQAVQDGVTERILQLALDTGVDRILTWSLHEEGRQNLPWLLELGGTLRDEDDIEAVYAQNFWDAYTRTGDAHKAMDSLNAFLDEAYSQMAPKLAEGLRATCQAMKAGSIEKDSGVERLPTEEEMAHFAGFRLDVYEDEYSVYIDGKPPAGRQLFGGKGGETDDVHRSVAFQFMPAKLRHLIEKLGAEGVFDGLAIPQVRVTCNGEVLFHKVLDVGLLAERQQAAEALVQRLEATTQWEEDAPLLGDAVSYLLNGLLTQDVPRASALIGRFLYSVNGDAERKAIRELCAYDEQHGQLQYDLALWNHQNGEYWSAYCQMGFAAEQGYVPAAEKQAEFKELARLRAKRRDERCGGKQTGSDKVRAEDFTEQDLFVDSENLIARAYDDGIILIRFKTEGEAGYGEALDFLNNLLEKGYNRLHDGYMVQVRLLAKPQFIPGLPGFPKTTLHAFFAVAVQYPALREKVRHYAELAMVEYQWYADLDGEHSAMPGTFAAAALALCDEDYIPLAGQYARLCDGDHQEIQLQLAPALAKQYGPTPEVAKVVFDICATDMHGARMGRLPQELYTDPANLRAITEHIDSGLYTQQRLEWCFTKSLGRMMTSKVKSNLKKLKGIWQATEDTADKEAVAEFYNLYKAYATAQDNEDYGEDLTSGPRADMVLPSYEEDSPVVMSLDGFTKHYPDTKIDNTYPAEPRTALFVPPVMDDPRLLDYVFRQWDALTDIWRDAPSSLFWIPGVWQMGNWAVNLNGPAKEVGAILYSGNAKPIVLYGVLNMAPLFTRFHKRPFKTPEAAEGARLANLLREAEDYRPIPPQQLPLYERCAYAFDAILGKHHYTAGKLLETFTPEDGRVYDAALLLRARRAAAMLEFDEERAAYEQLATRRPEYADYWREKLA